MTKQTQLRNLRKNLPEVLKDGENTGQRRFQAVCPVCGYPMWVSEGQIVTAHKGRCKRYFKAHNRQFNDEKEISKTIELPSKKID